MMGRLIDILKVAEDEKHVAYCYKALNERSGLVVVDKLNRDFWHVVSSDKHQTYFAVRHKLKQCLDNGEFPEKLCYASGQLSHYVCSTQHIPIILFAACETEACRNYHANRSYRDEETRVLAEAVLNKYRGGDGRLERLRILQSNQWLASSNHIAMQRQRAVTEATDICGVGNDACIAKTKIEIFDDWVFTESNKAIMAGLGMLSRTILNSRLGRLQAGGAGNADGGINRLKHGAGQVPDLTGKPAGEAIATLKKAGFVDIGPTAGKYRKFYHPDGSKIQIRANGEIVRNGPKIQNPHPNEKGYNPRIDQNG